MKSNPHNCYWKKLNELNCGYWLASNLAPLAFKTEHSVYSAHSSKFLEISSTFVLSINAWKLLFTYVWRRFMPKWFVHVLACHHVVVPTCPVYVKFASLKTTKCSQAKANCPRCSVSKLKKKNTIPICPKMTSPVFKENKFYVVGTYWYYSFLVEKLHRLRWTIKIRRLSNIKMRMMQRLTLRRPSRGRCI